MVRFPGSNHELSRSGKPVLRVARLNQIIRWCDEHIKKNAEDYTYRCNIGHRKLNEEGESRGRSSRFTLQAARRATERQCGWRRLVFRVDNGRPRNGHALRAAPEG
jgi:hypothetical protein